GIGMIMEEINVSEAEAEALLKKEGSVRKAVEWYHKHAGH
ncbi:MAG: hypothetical protein JWO58_2852, partial [Chitinophagaceae bacterium]|nr:hypothetical protein [Chitinophagaceae bacterium]